MNAGGCSSLKKKLLALWVRDVMLVVGCNGGNTVDNIRHFLRVLVWDLECHLQDAAHFPCLCAASFCICGSFTALFSTRSTESNGKMMKRKRI